MEFDQGYHNGPNSGLGYPFQSYHHDSRNVGLAIANGARSNPRVCPVAIPVGGTRMRFAGGREEDHEPSRRSRVAVACARCRKRKIRCSGDPGDGTGCQNCNKSGVDATLCQFHRVGSGEASSMLQSRNTAENLIHLYNTQPNFMRQRPLSYHGMDAKPTYSHPFAVQYSEETSPVEAYGLDQATGYLPTQGQLPYSTDYRWDTDAKPYLAPAPEISSYGSQHLQETQNQYTENSIRAATSSEALSHSMMQLTLPERPHTRPTLPQSQRPQLPAPHISFQSSRNVVDQLQDQRLRSARAMGSSSIGSSGFVRPSLPSQHSSNFQITDTSDSGVSLAVQVPVSSAHTAQNLTSYSSSAPATTADEFSNSTGAPCSFPISSFYSSTQAPLAQPTYSNCRENRDSKPYLSPSDKKQTPHARVSSQNNLYSVGSSSDSKDISGANDSMLLSGLRYTPLSHIQPSTQPPNQPQQHVLKSLGKKSIGHRPSPITTHLMNGTINRSF